MGQTAFTTKYLPKLWENCYYGNIPVLNLKWLPNFVIRIPKVFRNKKNPLDQTAFTTKNMPKLRENRNYGKIPLEYSTG